MKGGPKSVPESVLTPKGARNNGFDPLSACSTVLVNKSVWKHAFSRLQESSNDATWVAGLAVLDAGVASAGVAAGGAGGRSPTMRKRSPARRSEVVVVMLDIVSVMSAFNAVYDINSVFGALLNVRRVLCFM